MSAAATSSAIPAIYEEEGQSYILSDYKFGPVTLRAYSIKGFLGDILDEYGIDLTGTVAWPCSFILCKYIVGHAAEFQGKKVLELGAGAGLCSLVSSHYAASVVATDCARPVLNLARRNMEINGRSSCRVSVSRLIWGEELETFPHQPNDIIIGSEIVYPDADIAALFRTVDALLSTSDDARFYLLYRPRFTQTNDALLECAALQGFQYELVDMSSLVSEVNDAAEKIAVLGCELYIFRRRQNLSSSARL